MTNATLEERTAKLEGALEQIDKRLSNVEVIVQDMRNEMHELYRDLCHKVDSLDRKFDTQLSELNQNFTGKVDSLDRKFDTKLSELNHKVDANLKWILGLLIPILIGVIMSIVFG